MPWNRVLRFADPLPCEAAVQGSDVEILPTKSGDFQTEIAQIGMNRLWMQRFHVALPQVSTVASESLPRTHCDARWSSRRLPSIVRHRWQPPRLPRG